MDKKKVKELTRKLRGILFEIRSKESKDDSNLCISLSMIQEIEEELSKSDWVSVKDELPPYDKKVIACNKIYPEHMVITVRCKDVFYDNHNFIIQNVHITHWKPIEKLKE